jgi:hypothetical protein
MSEVKSVHSILDVIKNITANHESGRLEIDACGTPGTFLFNEGKLVHASLGSLKGFPAVNAAVALRDLQFSFDHVTPASHLSTISQNERVVLKRFFGIEVAEMEEANHTVEPDWNPEPEPVVPLTAVEIPQNDPEQTPTVEVSPVRSSLFAFARQSAFFSRRGIAAGLALLLALAVGAIALRSKLQAPQQSAAVTAVDEAAPSSVPVSQPEVNPVAVESPSVAISEQPNTHVRIDTPGPVVSTVRRESDERAGKIQDLTGEWQVINTVQNTGYKSFDKMQLGFRLRINQKGKEFTAKGEKFSENGQTLPAVRRTPIHVTGSIEGDQVVATFVEDGRLRRSNGRFVWKLQNGGDALAGTFVSTAANSRGRSAVTKQ